MKKLSILLMFLSLGVFGQIGIGTDNIAPSEALRVDATNKGVLLPHTFLENLSFKPHQLDKLTNYLIVYNTNPDLGKGFYYWLDGKWISMLNGTSSYRGSEKLRLETAFSNNLISINNPLENIKFNRDEALSDKDWVQIPGLEKQISITSSDNHLIFMVDGQAQFYTTSTNNLNTATYSIGLFIDDKLYAVRDYTITSPLQCGLNNFTFNATMQNMSPGRHTIRVLALLKSKSTDKLTLFFGANTQQCNTISSDMSKITLAIKISEADNYNVYPPEPPVMGWASWNNYRVNISQDIIQRQADYLVSTGLKDAGYNYINIDDGYFGNRDASGKLQINKNRFPNGMKVVADYIHSKGLKAGIYSDAGANSCASKFDNDAGGIGAGLYQHEKQDLNLFFNDWGYDYIKVDYCGASMFDLKLDEETYYTQIRNIIDRISHKYINYNVCRWQFPGGWVSKVGNSWRVSKDIEPTFGSMMDIIEKNTFLAAYMSPGHYNDMDMLQVGRGMSENEDKAQMSMWAVLTSPMLLGNDLSTMNKQTLDIIENKDVIAINQDMTEQGHLISNYGDGLQVWAKHLNGKMSGEFAVVLFNTKTSLIHWDREITINFSDLGLSGNVSVRDIWAKKDLGNLQGSYTASVPYHGVVMLKIKGTYKHPNVYEAEYAYLNNYNLTRYTEVVPGQAKPYYDKYSSKKAAVGYIGNSEENYIEFRDVYAYKSGYYDLAIYYSSGGRYADMYVNDKGRKIRFPDSYGIIHEKIYLEKGYNKIKFNNAKAYTADLDKIEINEIN